MLGVQQWAEVRRLVLVEGRSQREAARLTGLARDTVARAVASETPPKYSRMPAGSKLDPFRDWICEQLQADHHIDDAMRSPVARVRVAKPRGENAVL